MSRVIYTLRRKRRGLGGEQSRGTRIIVPYVSRFRSRVFVRVKGVLRARVLSLSNRENSVFPECVQSASSL